jgi:hypothetical protein
MKKLFVCLALLMSSAFSQTAQTKQYFTTTMKVENPPYGLVAQVFNPPDSGEIIYIDSIDFSIIPAINYVVNKVDPSFTTNGFIGGAVGLSKLEEIQCQSGIINRLDWSNPVPATINDTHVRASMQPCTPRGMQYGIPYTGPGNCFGYNYTCTNPFGLGASNALNYALRPPDDQPLPPGSGVTVYSGRYILDSDPYCPGCAFGYMGYVYVNIRFHKFV